MAAAPEARTGGSARLPVSDRGPLEQGERHLTGEGRVTRSFLGMQLLASWTQASFRPSRSPQHPNAPPPPPLPLCADPPVRPSSATTFWSASSALRGGDCRERPCEAGMAGADSVLLLPLLLPVGSGSGSASGSALLLLLLLGVEEEEEEGGATWRSSCLGPWRPGRCLRLPRAPACTEVTP